MVAFTPAVPPMPDPRTSYESERYRLRTAYLLWLFLGFLGGHRIYLGRFGSGFLLMGLTALGIILTMAEVGVLLLGIVGGILFVDIGLVAVMVREENISLAKRFGLAD